MVTGDDESLSRAVATQRPVGGPFPVILLECLECGALLSNDRAVLYRHLDWHDRINRTVP